jgi:hypothetical protein
MGPNLQFHLAGGTGGIKPLEGVFGLLPVFKSLGDPTRHARARDRSTRGVEGSGHPVR